MPWYYKPEGEQGKVGPLQGAELQALARAGKITRKTPVKKDDDAWRPAESIPGLFAGSPSNPTDHPIWATIDQPWVLQWESPVKMVPVGAGIVYGLQVFVAARPGKEDVELPSVWPVVCVCLLSVIAGALISIVKNMEKRRK